MKNKLLLLMGVLPLFWSGVAQELKHCGTTEANQRFVEEHPELREQIRKNEEILANSGKIMRKAGTVYRIPIVFHIIHNYGTENISDAQVYSEMDQLSRDYRKLNADTSAIWPYFRPIAADCEIEFRLARIDPNGNPTTGIDRIASSRTYQADDGSKLNDWDPTKYLNVWVVKTIGSTGVAGYAYYPSNFSPTRDGILILSEYIGNIGTSQPLTGRALTHEIGHYLNLAHVWGNSNSPGVTCGDDGVADTPVSFGWNHCASQTESKHCDTIPENVQNFMEYSYCSNMFTLGQKARMVAALNSNVGGRNNLWKDTNLKATGTDDGYTDQPTALKPEFRASAYVVCTNATVTFNDLTYNGKPASRKWNFNGGTVVTGTDTSANPQVTFSTPGDYDISLTVSNAKGSDTLIKQNVLHVVSNGPGVSPSYGDGLEYTQVKGSGWQVLGLTDDKADWTFGNSPAVEGTYCAKLNLFNANHVGNTHELVTPTIDFTKFPKAYLHFKVAYVKRGKTSTDQLNILYTYDCTDSWFAVSKAISADSLASAPNSGSAFTPADASQWRAKTVYLSPKYIGYQAGGRFKFSVTVGNNGNTNTLSPGGNNLYLDGISIDTIPYYTFNSTVGISKIEMQGDMLLYPNPAQGDAMLSLDMNVASKVSVFVYDIVGREVAQPVKSELMTEGNHKVAIHLAHAGMYIVKVKMDDNSEKAFRLISQ